jgi:hypothetical protein
MTALNATVVVTALARHAGTPRATSRRYSGAQTAATVTARNTVASTSRRMAAAATARTTTIPERAQRRLRDTNLSRRRGDETFRTGEGSGSQTVSRRVVSTRPTDRRS